MIYIEITIIALLIDVLIGEFKIKHPVVFIGEYISWFEFHFYGNSILRGFILLFTLLLIITLIALFIQWLANLFPFYLELSIISIIASTGLAGNMLYHSVRDVLSSDNPANAVSMLVSRDTDKMTMSDVYKACLETYSENLSDGLIAPIFYLLIFGLEGLMVYKTVNTLDSMIGYRTARYQLYGRTSAILDDILNYIPSRITGILIFLVTMKLSSIKSMLKYGCLHSSPNAGYPISSIAGALDLSLGGDTWYHGILKSKPYFGDGRKVITFQDVSKGLSIHYRIIALLFIILIGLYLWKIYL